MADRSAERYADNVIGTITATLGVLLLIIADFLPLVQTPPGFTRIQSNSLVQHEGWALILLGIGIVAAELRLFITGRRAYAWVALALSLVCAALVAFAAQDKSLRTLYALNFSGEAQAPERTTVVAPFDVAIYLAAVGAGLAVIGGIELVRGVKFGPRRLTRATKRCPECAETVLAEARLCKHCGYRFPALAGEAGGVRAKPQGGGEDSPGGG